MGLIDYQDFVRANSEYLTTPDVSSLDITGDLTIGCWVYFDPESTDVTTGIIGKYYEATSQRAYCLYKDFVNRFIFMVSSNGVNLALVHDGGVSYRESKWFYLVGRYTAGTELALFINGMWYRKTVGIPASIHNSSESLDIGRVNRASYLDGRIAHAFLCAYAVPDNFICAMYGHAKALFLGLMDANNPCSSTSSSTSSSSSSSTTSSSSSSHAP